MWPAALWPAWNPNLPAAARDLIGAGSPNEMLTWLEGQPAAVRAPILLSSLAAAVAELEQRLGGPMEGWAWGRLHVAEFEPAIAAILDGMGFALLMAGLTILMMAL